MNDTNKRLIKPEGFDMNEVIEYLQGGCKTLSEGLEGLYEIDEAALSKEDLEAIDQEIFNCSGCGWWFEISEQQDEGMCGDCYENMVDPEEDEGEDE